MKPTFWLRYISLRVMANGDCMVQDQERAVKYLEGAALKGRIIHIEKVAHPIHTLDGVETAAPFFVSPLPCAALDHLPRVIKP